MKAIRLHARGGCAAVRGDVAHAEAEQPPGPAGGEHRSRSMSIFLSGGGMRMGQVVGSTNHKGEEPRDRPVTPGDFLATLYRHLGVDWKAHFPDHSGRPVPILPHGQPLDELTGV